MVNSLSNRSITEVFGFCASSLFDSLNTSAAGGLQDYLWGDNQIRRILTK
jgi:hypothetical protein